METNRNRVFLNSLVEFLMHIKPNQHLKTAASYLEANALPLHQIKPTSFAN